MSQSSDANRFRVVTSPYMAIRPGAIGLLVRKEFMNSDLEAWVLDFGKLGKWRFFPSEVVPV